MKTLYLTVIVIVFLVFSGINFVFAQKAAASVKLIFLSPDKEIYFPGDSVFIHGQDNNMNVTSITVGLEKDHKVMVSSEDFLVLKNGTFYANFALPRDSDAKYWSLVSESLRQDLYFKPVYLSPLEQFREGIESSKTRCEDSLDLVISHYNLPACVKPDTAQILIERGWAKEIVSSTSVIKTTLISDALQLLLSTNSTVIMHNQTLGIDVVINNTSPNMLVKDLQNNWPMNELSMGPCQLDPVGIGIYQGNYTLENIASARLLQLYQNGTYNCPALTGVDRYVFEPSSDMAVLEAANGNHTGEVMYYAPFDGFYTVDGFVPPKVGVYTILSDDQWGHIAIQHFVVTNSTKH